MRTSMLPNGMAVNHRWFESLDVLHEEVQAYFGSGVELREGDCILDVGANIGVFSLEALEQVGPSGRIFAFEPIPGTFEVLRRNAKQHGEVIHAFNLGMFDTCREATFHSFSFGSGLSSMYACGDAKHRSHMKRMIIDKVDDPDLPEVYRKLFPAWVAHIPKPVLSLLLTLMLPITLHSKKVKCRLSTVSDIIREHDIDEIALLKIDAEMAELDVLRGIDQEHWPRIRQVTMEVHDIEGRIEVVRELLAQHGFHKIHVEQEVILEGTEIFGITALRG